MARTVATSAVRTPQTKAVYLSVRAALGEVEKAKYGILVSVGGPEGVDFGIIGTDDRRELRLIVTSTIPNNKFMPSSQALNPLNPGLKAHRVLRCVFTKDLGLISFLQIYCCGSRL